MENLQVNRKELSLSRRRFLQATGALGASAALTGGCPDFLVKSAQAAEDVKETQSERIHTLCGACPQFVCHDCCLGKWAFDTSKRCS